MPSTPPRSLILSALLLFFPAPARAAETEQARVPIVIDGLSAPASLWWDVNGIAHIEAQDLHDAFAVQGYAAATMRMFQIDQQRRLTAGRSAELFGPDNLMVDLMLRRMQLSRAADAFLQGATAENTELYGAFAAGINTYLDQARAGEVQLSPEYADLLLGADDIPDWTIHDSALAGTLVLFGLSSPFIPELLVGLPRDTMLPATAHDLTRVAPAAPTPVIYPDELGVRPPSPSPSSSDSEAENLAKARAAIDERDRRLDPDWLLETARLLRSALDAAGVGETVRHGASNAWVVGPELSASGHAMVCNDPHLDPQAYNQVLLVRIVTPGGTFTGGNFAALPGTLFGHNDYHAVGFTALNADNLDVFHEVVPFPGMVQHRGTLVPIQRTREIYMANIGGELVDMTFNFPDPDSYWVPHHGPILAWGPLHLDALSYKWAGHRPGGEVNAVLDVMTATNFDDFIAAEGTRQVTAANAVYGDIDGRIHYAAHLRYPKRSFPHLAPPWWILPGGGLFDWQGSLDFAEQPNLTDPERGWIATANNDPMGLCFDNKPLNEGTYQGVSYAPGFRAQRIGALIDSLAGPSGLTPLDMARIQGDGKWGMASRFVQHLIAAADARPDLISGASAEAIARLRDWGFGTGTESVQPSIFQGWFGHFCEAVLSDDLGLTYDLFMDTGLASNGLLYVLENPESSETGERLFDDLRTLFATETREEMILRAMDRAMDTLADLFGSADQESWRWGDAHGVTLLHPMRGDYNVPAEGEEPLHGIGRRGAAYTVDVGSTGVDPADLTCRHQAVMRFISELDPEGIKSWWMLDSGNGGPGTGHWGDLADDYVANRYFRIDDDRANQEGEELGFVPG
ncbi:MAG: hypothetical protein CME06_14115 [Gemmatimonadetes bacterium]|nr:hypothetical protein [Gemmatimonadota bacterium]